MKHRQQIQTKQATKDVDKADNSLRHSRSRRSGRGIDSKCRRGKLRKMQMKQITNQGIANANGADEAQTANANKASYGRRRRSKQLTKAQ